MKPPEGLCDWPDYTNLYAWLKVATKGLSDDSRARIRDEITDHFQQALDDGMRAGLSEDDAAQRAVEGLGSPKSARRAFRRTYLTRWQANIVRSFVDARKPTTSSSILSTALDAERGWRRSWQGRLLLSAIMVLLVASRTALMNQHLSLREWQLHIGIVAVMLVATSVLAAVPRIFRNGRERMAIALGSFAELVLWGGFIIAPEIGPFSRTINPPGLSFWLAGVLFIVWAALHLPLLLKLSRRQEST